MPAKYQKKNSDYHVRKFKRCKYCDQEAKRMIINGRNKGHYRTCGSEQCLKANYSDPKVIERKRHVGSNHPRFKADRSQIKSSRPRFELTKWTKAVFERDNYTCQACGQKGGRLQAHHIKEYSRYPEFRWDLDNGQTLCEECHKITPNYAGRKYVTGC